MLRPRVVQIAVLIFLLTSLSFTTTAAFAYWRDVTVETIVDVTFIGEGAELIVTDLNDELEGRLVPEGRAYFVGDVESITLSYDIGLSRDLINVMELVITAEDVLINDNATYSHLIDIQILDGTTGGVIDIFRDVITVTVTIRLIEPIDEEEAIIRGLSLDLVNVEDSRAAYEAIKGQNVTFGLRFELRNKSESVSE